MLPARRHFAGAHRFMCLFDVMATVLKVAACRPAAADFCGAGHVEVKHRIAESRAQLP